MKLATARCLIVAALCVLLGACTGAYRTNVAVENDCVAGDDGMLGEGAAACRAAVGEYAQRPDEYSYTLFFVEFDDQGWAYDDNAKMDAVLAQVRKKLQGETRPDHRCVEAGSKSVHLVLFVHGWKHTAAYDDGNVASFRNLLREAATAECKGAANRREVIGIYVGWRGRPAETPEALSFLDNLTFWDRKAAAIDVAQGGAREFFARLDAMADRANQRDPAGKAVRMLLIGHSFGGHILLTSLGGTVLRSLTPAVDDDPLDAKHCSQTQLSRDGDMIVIVNAAIEGTRFEPIHSMGRKWKVPCYKAPVIVAVTSEGDSATRDFFPLGRWVSTVFERYVTPEQRRADTHTLGHNDRYLTHELGLRSDDPRFHVAKDRDRVPQCEGWSNEPGKLIASIQAEFRNAFRFAEAAKKEWKPREPRAFCAGAVLIPITKDGQPEPLEWRAPVMNIRVTKSLVPDHSSIYSPQFVSFIRELYMDTLRTGP